MFMPILHPVTCKLGNIKFALKLQNKHKLGILLSNKT